MPESGSVVRALEEVAADNDPRDGCAHADAAKAALPQAREQEALLREYRESHRWERNVWVVEDGLQVLKICPCTLCKRARKVLP